MFLVTLTVLVFELVALATVLSASCADDGECSNRPMVVSTFHVSRSAATQAASHTWPVSLVGSEDAQLACLRVADVVPACTADKRAYDECLRAQRPGMWAVVQLCGDNPTAAEFLSCVDQGRNFSRGTVNVFLRCARASPWYLHEVPQGVDSAVFMGAYNWPVVLLTGFGIYAGFCVYVGFPVMLTVYALCFARRDEQRWPVYVAYEVGAGLAAVLCLSLLALNMLLVFNQPTVFKSNQFPTTSSTAVVTLVASALAVLYFVKQTVAGGGWLTGAGAFSLVSKPVIKVQLLRPAVQQQRGRLGAPFQRVARDSLLLGQRTMRLGPNVASADASPPVEEEPNVPYHLYAASSLCDCLLVVGMLGGEQDLQTSLVWSVFWLVLYTRACGLVVAEQVEDLKLLTDEDASSSVKRASEESVKRASEEGSSAKWLLLTCTLVAEVALALACAVTLSLGGYTVALTFFILATFFDMLTQISSAQTTPPAIFSWGCWLTGVLVRTAYVVASVVGPLSVLGGLQESWSLLHRAFAEYGANTFVRSGPAYFA